MDPIDAEGHVLFRNYSYHNVGLPRFEDNPFYTTLPTINPNGSSAIDLGLGAVVNDPQQNGKFRTPSLRNVAVTGPYFHHGGVATLEEAVHFMVARDAMELQPELKENMEHKWIGGMQLTAPQEKALVAFLQLLTDGFTEVP
jgi:cytochrome c peroxidase